MGGLYAYVMILAWEMTRQKRYLEEAEKAIRAVQAHGFITEYQSNVTAWGVTACMRLWRITEQEFYRQQSYMFLANFFNNTILWESNLGNAAHYPVFTGATCLHDSRYMAIYECFESFAAFQV